MSVELPKDAKGREIPLDTVALFNRVGNVYSIVRWTYAAVAYGLEVLYED